MSLLWCGLSHKKQLTILKRPSPKHNSIPCFAQSKSFRSDKLFPVYLTKSPTIEGISLYTSLHHRTEGSMTVETAIVLPLFIFFFLNLGGAIEMIRLHGNLQLALWNTGNMMSVYGHVLEDASDPEQEGVANSSMNVGTGGTKVNRAKSENLMMELAGVALNSTYVKRQIVKYLGSDYLKASPLRNGSDSLLFVESDVREQEDTFEIVLTYSVVPLLDVSRFRTFRMSNKYYGHVWNGYAIPLESSLHEQVAYITQTGEVYHLDRFCTHLKLSIRQVSMGQIYIVCNEAGEQYEACEKCCTGMSVGHVFITKQGECYHYMLDCPGLKRTVYEIPLSDTGTYRACTRCTAEGE